MSFLDSVLNFLYKVGEACIEDEKKKYSNENIRKYGKEHGFSDEHIEEVCNNVAYKIYDQEDALDYIKDKVEDVRYTIEDTVDYYRNRENDEDSMECNNNIDNILKDVFCIKIEELMKIAERFSQDKLPIIIQWRNGNMELNSNLILSLETDIDRYNLCYIENEYIEEYGEETFIELTNEIKRFIKVNQMLIYGIKNNQFNIVDDAISRFFNLMSKYSYKMKK